MYRILENKPLIEGKNLYNMLIHAPEIASKAQPGQIVHLICGEGTLLRRPLSVCETVDDDKIRLCFEVRGKGTKWLSERTPGELLDIIGPYGKGFSQGVEGRVLLVGGGIGIYPLVFAGKRNKNAKALLGFRNAGLINSVELFENNNTACDVITDDGSNGRKGLVTDLLRNELQSEGADLVCVCGPKPMMAAVAALCEEFNIRCEVSMEERMGCGVGACLACVCKTQFVDNDKRGEHYKRVCIDGPVFDAKEIIF